jgi:non-homologous end joining protein Ku
MIDTIKEAIKDQIDANETMVKTINKIVDNMNTQRELIEMQDKINRKLIQDIQDIKLELNSNKKRANKKWKA